MKKGPKNYTIDHKGFPIEIKKMKKNILLTNDFYFGIVKKISEKKEKPTYGANPEVVELNNKIESPKRYLNDPQKKRLVKQETLVKEVVYTVGKKQPLEELIEPSKGVKIKINNLTK